MDHLDLFPTPLLVVELPDVQELNLELSERLISEEATTPTIHRSNVGAWHSAPDLSGRTEACYVTLIQAIVDRAAGATERLSESSGHSPDDTYRFSAIAWAIVMHAGHYVTPHDHGDAHWSAVYYVDPGDADTQEHPQSGLLALADPRRSGAPFPGLGLFPSTFTVRPRAGTLLLFPGWLQHYVHPYRGSRPRISISCNLALQARLAAGGARDRDV